MGIKSRGSTPSGLIQPYAGATIPAGWLACAGQAVSRATYAALFIAIGTTYGVGDGATTFNLPDLRGRALFGKDDMNGSAANRITSGGSGVAGATLGAVGGGETVTLSTAQIPSHTHAEQTNSAAGSGSGIAATGALTATLNQPALLPVTGASGTGGAHNNIPPAMVVNYIIKT